jgi:hypothetical protein
MPMLAVTLADGVHAQSGWQQVEGAARWDPIMHNHAIILFLNNCFNNLRPKEQLVDLTAVKVARCSPS